MSQSLMQDWTPFNPLSSLSLCPSPSLVFLPRHTRSSQLQFGGHLEGQLLAANCKVPLRARDGATPSFPSQVLDSTRAPIRGVSAWRPNRGVGWDFCVFACNSLPNRHYWAMFLSGPAYTRQQI